MNDNTILVTGATGFVGSAFVRLARSKGYRVFELCRNGAIIGANQAIVDWAPVSLAGASVVVHLAARTHMIYDNAFDPLEEYRLANVKRTANLAELSVKFGVKRFLYVSSIKVNGESTCLGRPFSELSPPAPEDFYGISKWEAEQAVIDIAGRGHMEYVIVRPPLVYGEGVRANFRSMLKLVQKGVPLPLGSVVNKRSFISRQNLVDFLMTCLHHKAAGNETFLVSDQEDVSTKELILRMARLSQSRITVFPFPIPLLKLFAAIIGKSAMVNRLLGSLQVDSAKATRMLGWVPPFSLNDGLKATVDAFRGEP